MKKLTSVVAPLALVTLALAGCPSPNTADTGPGDSGPSDTPTVDSPTNDTPTVDTPVVNDGTDAPIGGNDCTTYCTEITTNCTGANAQYNDMADCMAYCTAAMWPAGTPGEQSGNTLACRIYHGGSPAASMPDVHCSHAGPSGAAVCGTVNFRTDAASTYTRVDRIGMPAVSTALVPSAQKNAYNDADPANDSNFAGTFVNTLTALHTALDPDLMTLHLTPCSMTTLVGTLPECLGQMYGAGHTVASLIVPNDVITLDPTVAAGFPNGRRLEDPVIDVTLAVLLLRLNLGICGTGTTTCSATTLASIPLNPGHNDVTNLTEFPYLAPAHAP